MDKTEININRPFTENISDQLSPELLKEAVAQGVKAAILAKENLWTAEQIGQYMGGLKKHTVLYTYACRPDFPAPFVPPDGKIRLWNPADVKRWMEKYKERRQLNKTKKGGFVR